MSKTPFNWLMGQKGNYPGGYEGIPELDNFWDHLVYWWDAITEAECWRIRERGGPHKPDVTGMWVSREVAYMNVRRDRIHNLAKTARQTIEYKHNPVGKIEDEWV